MKICINILLIIKYLAKCWCLLKQFLYKHILHVLNSSIIKYKIFLNKVKIIDNGFKICMYMKFYFLVLQLDILLKVCF